MTSPKDCTKSLFMRIVVHLLHSSASGAYSNGLGCLGLLPSANYFQKSMSYFVFREPRYQICKVYIDDLLIYGTDDHNFVQNAPYFKNVVKERNT